MTASAARTPLAYHPAMRLLALIACICLAACSGLSTATAPAATYLLVRHAEKDLAAGKDPPLTAAGQARVERLAAQLAGTRLDAIYSSPTRRTRLTAAPTAEAKQLQVVDYDPADAGAFAQRLRREHPRGTVLVVGHSDTLPPLARALCGCAVADMDGRLYDVRYAIRFDADGRAHFSETRD